MNPQDQNQPYTPVESTPEADEAALQAIEALESEELGATQEPPAVSIITPIESTPAVAGVTDAQVEAATSLEPVATSVPINPTPILGDQTVSVPDTSPVEATASGVAAAIGAQQASQTVATQAPVSEPIKPFASEKKSSKKLLIILLVVVLAVVAGVVGYFAWQSMSNS